MRQSAAKILYSSIIFISYRKTEEILDKIKKYGDLGMEAKEIALELNFPYYEYFIGIINNIINLTDF